MTRWSPRALLEPESLTPGIRGTVAWLRQLGFETTDSGDGVTNVGVGMEHALPFPHVVIVVKDRRGLVTEARRLCRKLRQRGVVMSPAGRGGPSIEATFDPVDNSAVIVLTGVDDLLLESYLGGV